MESADGRFDGGEEVSPRLDDKQIFAVTLDLTLPAVDGLDVRRDVNARGELGFNQALGDLASLLAVAACHQDDDLVGHFVSLNRLLARN